MHFFFGGCYSYGPQQGPDRQQKKEEEGLKQRRKQKEAAQGDPELKKGNQEKEKKPSHFICTCQTFSLAFKSNPFHVVPHNFFLWHRAHLASSTEHTFNNSGNLRSTWMVVRYVARTSAKLHLEQWTEGLYWLLKP
jgi:hypothetical protein